MDDLRRDTCPDCAVGVGEPHVPGCDVERCKLCGWQAIGCDCPSDRMSTRWMGRWPGDLEVTEGLAEDLNDLYMKYARGELLWDPDAERLILAWKDGEPVVRD